MGDNVDKRTVAALLVLAVLLSVVATWKVLNEPPKVTYVGPSQESGVSLGVDQTQANNQVPIVPSVGAPVVLSVEESK